MCIDKLKLKLTSQLFIAQSINVSFEDDQLVRQTRPAHWLCEEWRWWRSGWRSDRGGVRDRRSCQSKYEDFSLSQSQTGPLQVLQLWSILGAPHYLIWDQDWPSLFLSLTENTRGRPGQGYLNIIPTEEAAAPSLPSSSTLGKIKWRAIKNSRGSILEEGLGQDTTDLDALSGNSWKVSTEIESKFLHNLSQIRLIFDLKAGQFEIDLSFCFVERLSTDNLRPQHFSLPTGANKSKSIH